MASPSDRERPPAKAGTPFLPWKEDFAIGIRQFDEEHERLGALICHLHLTMVVRRDREISAQIFQKLIQETRRHFTREEELLTDVGYPEREAHIQEHAKLLEEVHELFQKYQVGSISALALPNFLKAWLIKHIHDSDRAYVAFLKAQGIS